MHRRVKWLFLAGIPVLFVALLVIGWRAVKNKDAAASARLAASGRLALLIAINGYSRAVTGGTSESLDLRDLTANALLNLKEVIEQQHQMTKSNVDTQLRIQLEKAIVEKKIELQKAEKELVEARTRLYVQVGLTAVLVFSCLWTVLRKTYTTKEKSIAIGVLGAVIGYWLK